MTPLDYFVLVVAGVSLILGLARGLVKSLMSVASAVAGLVAAAYLYPYAGHVAGWFISNPAADFVGFVGIFLLVLIAGAFVSRSLRGAIKRARLGWADRVLGGVFGLVTAWLICSVVYLALTAFPIRIDAVERAAFSPVLLEGTRAISYITSTGMRMLFRSGYNTVADAWHHPNERQHRK
jgi:membrane protein required for colicin V production